MVTAQIASKSKLIACCEILKLVDRYFKRRFGTSVDGIVFFDEEDMDNNEFHHAYLMVKSLFNYWTKNEMICEECKQNWKRKIKNKLN